MSDHDFEKQVHQKLEELKLRPSDTVWMEVEKNIRKDNRRRRFLWLWVPMLFICLSTSAYILYRLTMNEEKTAGLAQVVPTSASNTHTTETLNATNKQITSIQPAPDNDAQAGKNTTVNSIQQTDRKQPAISTPATAHETTPVLVSSNEKQPPAIAVTEKNTEEKAIGNNHKRPVRKPNVVDDYDTGPLAIQKPVADYDLDNLPAPGLNNTTLFTRGKPRYGKKKAVQNTIGLNESLVTQEPYVQAEDLKPGPDAMDVTIPLMVKDVDNTIATNKTVTTPFNSKMVFFMMPDSGSNTAAAVSIPRKRPALWHWGIVTDAGFSRIAESKLFQLRGLLGQEKYLAESLSYRNVTADTNSLLNLSGSNTVTKNASPIQPDCSFSVGIFVQRAISKRFKLSLGIEYTYMSVNTQVGQRVNSPTVINTGSASSKVVPYYYKLPGYVPASADATITNGATAGYQGSVYYSQKHRYRFQYIEMPLLVNWQINKGRRLPPFVLEGGVSISHLLSVDAMHFEGVKGIYYPDNDLFNKTQFNFRTGLSVGLLQKSKHPIWIGPDLRYSLNGLVNKNVSTGQYLWSAGISVKMLLGRL